MRSVNKNDILVYTTLVVATILSAGCTTTEQQLAGGFGGLFVGGPVGAAAGYGAVTAYQAQQANASQGAMVASCQADVDRVGTWAAKQETKGRKTNPTASNDWRNVIPDGDGGTNMGRAE